MNEVEKTCEYCEYEYEDVEGTHCRHCIHNATENFKEKEIRGTEKELRNKAIDEYMNLLFKNCWEMKNECYNLDCPFCGDGCEIVNIARKMKGV